MISSVKILTEASSDIKDITAWYKDVSSLLALRFVSQLYDGFAKISSNPDAWFNIAKGIRRYRLTNFLYFILFYRDGKDIIVFAIIHEKRHPRNWKRRLRRK